MGGLQAVTVEQLQSLALYNRWANARLLQVAATLSDEERERDLRASFGSLHGTLIHILWDEQGWLHFWQAGSFVPAPTAGEYSGFASLRSAWSHHDDAYPGYLHRPTQAELDAPCILDTDTYLWANSFSTPSTFDLPSGQIALSYGTGKCLHRPTTMISWQNGAREGPNSCLALRARIGKDTWTSSCGTSFTAPRRRRRAGRRGSSRNMPG